MRKFILFTGIILFILFTLALFLFAFAYQEKTNASLPSISFSTPRQGDTIQLNDAISIQFTARDKKGIQQIELWIDGELYASRESALADGTSPFPIMEIWEASTPGLHVFTARATSTAQKSSSVSVVIEVTEPVPSDEEGLPEDVEEISEESAAEEPAGAETDTGAGSPLERMDEGLIIDPLDEAIYEFDPSLMDVFLPPLLPREGAGGILLEVEALSLETGADFDGVFCYYSLTGMPTFEKVPDEGFFDTAGSRQWDIATYLGGDNKRMVLLPEEQDNMLGMTVECYGAILEAGAVYNLGMLTMIHMPVDWNGMPIHQHIDGPSGSFNISYRISIAGSGAAGGDGDELPAPVLYARCFELFNSNYCELEWFYPLEAREDIDGFLLVRNDTLFMDIPHAEEVDIILADLDGTMPACGETDYFYLMAYRGDPTIGEKSPQSNLLPIVSPCTYQWVKVQFVKFSGCYSGDMLVNTCGTGGSIGDCPELSEPDDSREWEWEMGCLYADFWANDDNIDVGQSGSMFDCFQWATGNTYGIADTYSVERDHVYLNLGEFDDLTVGMRVMDWDRVSSDDTQCYGEYVHSADELNIIAELPEKRMVFNRWFAERGGGGCTMQYVIEIMPLDWDPRSDIEEE